MGKEENKKRPDVQINIIITCLLLCSIWMVFISLFCFIAIRNQKNLSLKFAEIEAFANYNKDLAYRRWSAMHGGTYVPVTESTKPNPYLENIEERDIVTPSGRKMRLSPGRWMLLSLLKKVRKNK